MTIFRSSWVLLLSTGAAMAPVSLPAQGRDTTRTRTHVVRAGDTLWRIALDSLGDARRWREILQLNQVRIPSPDRLDAGTRLVLPGREPSAAQPLAFPSAVAPRQVEADTIVPRSAGAPGGRSIFYRERPSAPAPVAPPALGARADTGRKPIDPPAAVRVWEYVSSPYVVEESALRPAGRCLSVDLMRGAAGGASSAVRFGDRMAVAMQAGAGVPNGTRFVSARRGPTLSGLGVVIIPTGVLRIVASGGASTPTQAEVVAQFDELSCNDMLLGFTLPADTTTIRPAPVAGGATGRVVWIEGTALLPSLQHAVIIDLGSRDGLRTGDQVALITSTGEGPGALTTDAAIATIVRVAPRAATAIIIRQSSAAIEVGMRARVTAKLP
jgi:hypothetical protein